MVHQYAAESDVEGGSFFYFYDLFFVCVQLETEKREKYSFFVMPVTSKGRRLNQ